MAELIDSKTDRKRVRIQTLEFGVALATIGWVMIGVGLSIGLFSCLPLELLKPEFQLRFVAAVISTSTPCLLGALLVSAASLIAEENRLLRERATFVRLCSQWFALLLVLMLPLQLIAGLRSISEVREAEIQALRQRRQVIQGIKNASTESDLRGFISSLPDRPQIPELFDAPFPVIKQRVIVNLSNQYKSIEAQLPSIRMKRWEGFIGDYFRNGVQIVLMVIGFMALGQRRIQEFILIGPISPRLKRWLQRLQARR